MSDNIGKALLRIIFRLYGSLGSRDAASEYVGHPIDPEFLPLDLDDRKNLRQTQV